jgi:hypothetical protein
MSDEQFQDAEARKMSERYAFSERLKDMIPPWLQAQFDKRWAPTEKLTIPMPDPMQRMADVFARGLDGRLPQDARQLSDLLLIFGYQAVREYQVIANHYHKVASDALKCSLLAPFVIPEDSSAEIQIP